MSKDQNTALAALCILIVTLATTSPGNFPLQTVHAASLTIALDGHVDAWNVTDNANPPLTVAENDAISFRLRSLDPPVSHRFFVDVNKDGLDDECPPTTSTSGPYCSRSFSSTTAITFSMTVNFPVGDYVYYCAFHQTTMLAPFTVLTTGHDVAVSALATSRSFSYEGVSSQPIKVNVTARNLSAVFSETFDVTAHVGSNNLGTQSVTVPTGSNRIVTFSFDPSGLARGSYVLSAQAAAVPGETNTANNSLNDGSFVVRLKGDVTNDCAVNVDDLARVGAQFGKILTSPSFDSNADLNNDGAINVDDLAAVGSNFGRIC